MSDLRDEIARMTQRFDPEFGSYKDLADRILDLPEIAEALIAKKAMDKLEAAFAGEQQP